MVPTAGNALAELKTLVDDPLVEIVARLAKGPTDLLNREVILTDLVEADFAGYAPVRLFAAVNEDALDDDNYGEASPQRCEWTAGAVTGRQLLFGVYYTTRYDGGPWDLITCVPFDFPLEMYFEGQMIAFDATLVNVQDS